MGQAKFWGLKGQETCSVQALKGQETKENTDQPMIPEPAGGP